MATSNPLDPFAFWRDLLSQWEQGTNQLVNRTTESDAYAGGMGRTMGASLAAKKVADDLGKKYLQAMNLPSRADVEGLGERLHAIEDRLIALAQALEDAGVVASTKPAIAAPRRTRQPPPEAAPRAEPAARAKKRSSR